jgi:mannose-6-phosphate isomerase-like protein (cupin superfamily)
MYVFRSRRRRAVALGIALLGLIATSVALASHGTGTGVGLLAEGPTLNEVNFNAGPLKLRTKGPVRVRDARVVGSITAPFHTHPGPEIVVVDEGSVTLRINAGTSCEQVGIGPDQAYIVPPGTSFSLTSTAGSDFTSTLILPAAGPLAGPGEPC